jgi:steroid delta-isomerase-like uncharacterized protein
MDSDSKDLVRSFHELAWTKGDLEAAGELLAPDLVDHMPMRFPGRADGAAGLLQVVGTIRSALPDLVRTIEDQVAEGDRVVTRFTDRGTHRGELMGIPPTGREVEVAGINVEIVRDDRIAEVWHLEDLAGLLGQLGVLSAPA